jgi:ABC-2 type transport system ATP-binding protein
LIQGLARDGVTVLITTHFMDEAEFCGRIGFISGGRLIALDTPSVLKKDAVQEDLFEVDLASFRGAREKMDGLPHVLATSYFGARLHVFCERGLMAAGDLRGELQSRGLEPRSVEAVSVTLEDAFIRLVQKDMEARPA